LLSLPHAVRVSPAIAVADTVARTALPKVVRFTYPAFLKEVPDVRPAASAIPPATYSLVVDENPMADERPVNSGANARQPPAVSQELVLLASIMAA
jgi:hypothetical protein